MLLFCSTCNCCLNAYYCIFTTVQFYYIQSQFFSTWLFSVLIWNPLKLPAGDPARSGSALSPAEPLWGGGLISADINGHRPICCTLHSFHALPEVLCNYPDIDEAWFQQVIAGSSAVFTDLSKMSLSINSGKLISTQWPYSLLIIYELVCACVCEGERDEGGMSNHWQSSEP